MRRVLFALFLLIALPCLGGWALLGSGARRLSGSPTVLRRINRGLALLLLVSAWASLGIAAAWAVCGWVQANYLNRFMPHLTAGKLPARCWPPWLRSEVAFCCCFLHASFANRKDSFSLAWQ